MVLQFLDLNNSESIPMARILPEFVTQEDEDSDNDLDGTYGSRINKKKVEASYSSTSKYALRRKELKEQVIKDVMDMVMPDMGAFNMEEIIHGKKEKKQHWCVTVLMTVGILNISCQEAVLTGSIGKLRKNLMRNKLSKAPIVSLVDQRDVMFKIYCIFSLTKFYILLGKRSNITLLGCSGSTFRYGGASLKL